MFSNTVCIIVNSEGINFVFRDAMSYIKFGQKHEYQGASASSAVNVDQLLAACSTSSDHVMRMNIDSDGRTHVKIYGTWVPFEMFFPDIEFYASPIKGLTPVMRVSTFFLETLYKAAKFVGVMGTIYMYKDRVIAPRSQDFFFTRGKFPRMNISREDARKLCGLFENSRQKILVYSTDDSYVFYNGIFMCGIMKRSLEDTYHLNLSVQAGKGVPIERERAIKILRFLGESAQVRIVVGDSVHLAFDPPGVEGKSVQFLISQEETQGRIPSYATLPAAMLREAISVMRDGVSVSVVNGAAFVKREDSMVVLYGTGSSQ